MCGEIPEELHTDQPIELTVEARAHGWRVDHYLSRLFPNYSRALFQKAIAAKTVLLNGLPVKTSRRLRVNDRLSVRLPVLPDEHLPAEDIPLDIIFEDESMVVINKPAGMIVHPGKGNYHGTLAGALQFHFDQLSDVAGRFRPGIVHRLDRDTTGVILVAKDNQVHSRLSSQFERREVTKEYRAICHGGFHLDSDYIETHVRVHSKKREKMTVCEPGGNARDAVTFYEVLERLGDYTYVRLKPKTGRTHQLRVHMEHLKHSIVADAMYGGGSSLQRSEVAPRGSTTDEPDGDILISRQALHAFRIELRHPQTGQPVAFEAPLPEDFERTLTAMRAV